MSIRLFWLIAMVATPAFYGGAWARAMRGGKTTGDSLLVADSVWMSEFVISASKEPIALMGDTLIYDVASFRVPEGSRLRELLKRLPGIEVTSDGRVKAQGKDVRCIMLNGREFFLNNKELALDNLPVEILKNVKVYDKVSDKETETGINLGMEERVLDLTTHPDKGQGWFCNVTGGGGTEDRFVGQAAASQFNAKWQNMISGIYTNQPSRFGVGDGYIDKLNRRESSSDSRRQDYSAIVGRYTDNLEINGNVMFFGNEGKSGTETVSKNMLDSHEAYTHSLSESESKNRMFNAQFSLHWRDSLTNVHVDPSFSYNQYSGFSGYRSHTFNCNPYLFEKYPLVFPENIPLRHRVNTSYNLSNENNEELSLGVNGRINRKLSSKGRNLDFEFGVNYAHSLADSYTNTEVAYYQLASQSQTIRYIDNPTNSLMLNAGVAYTEPLSTRWKFRTEYKVKYNYRKKDQSVHDLQPLAFCTQQRIFQEVNWNAVYCDSLSKFAYNTYLKHNIKALVQYVYSGISMTAGLLISPQSLKTSYRKYRQQIDTIRNVVNIAPEIRLMANMNERCTFVFNYVGTSTQPDINHLLPILDDTDPLNQYLGNAGLRPAFTHSFSSNFMSFDTEAQQQITLNATVSIVQNALANSIRYNSKTGVTLSSPVNVNGNWNAALALGYTGSFGENRQWYMEWQSTFDYNHSVGIQTIDEFSCVPLMLKTRYYSNICSYSQYIGIQYTSGSLCVQPYAFGLYEGLRSNLNSYAKRDIYRFGYGAMLRYELDNGLTAAIDVYNHSRRGYAGQEMNGDELICDAELSYAFLKGKVAEVRVQAYDLLRNVKTIYGIMSQQGSSESRYTHSVNSYVMLTFSYRFGIFGK